MWCHLFIWGLVLKWQTLKCRSIAECECVVAAPVEKTCLMSNRFYCRWALAVSMSLYFPLRSVKILTSCLYRCQKNRAVPECALQHRMYTFIIRFWQQGVDVITEYIKRGNHFLSSIWNWNWKSEIMIIKMESDHFTLRHIYATCWPILDSESTANK